MQADGVDERVFGARRFLNNVMRLSSVSGEYFRRKKSLRDISHRGRNDFSVLKAGKYRLSKQIFIRQNCVQSFFRQTAIFANKHLMVRGQPQRLSGLVRFAKPER